MRAVLDHPAFGQLVRFVIAGLGVTAFSIAVYLFYAMLLQVEPLIANMVSHGAGVAAGYAVHSRWSFRSDARHGDTTILRFVIVSGVAFALNSLWVWLATSLLHGPAWLPVPAMLFVTPFASFALNRYWVFKQI